MPKSFQNSKEKLRRLDRRVRALLASSGRRKGVCPGAEFELLTSAGPLLEKAPD